MNKLRLAIFAAGAIALAATGASAQNVPPGQMPPAGLCRVWIDGVPPGRQQRATDCDAARRNAPANSRILYGGDNRLRTGSANGTYDPRRGTNDGSVNGTYDPRHGTNNGTYDPRYPGTNQNGTYDPRYPTAGTIINGGTYDPRRSRNDDGIYSRRGDKEREKWEKKREKEEDKAERRNNKGWGHNGKGHDRDRDGDDDRDDDRNDDR